MKKTTGLMLMATLFVLHAAAQNRSRISFNEGWLFKLDSTLQYSDVAAMDANSWRLLNLPHDWSIEGSFAKENPATAGGGALPGGIGWYRKTFSVPAADRDRKYYIEFDGVYRNSEVWINGHLLGLRPNGYISFQYDLTPYLVYGDKQNTIIVKADNLRQPNSRWYSGSGIYRNVWLRRVNKVNVDYNGTFVTTPRVSQEEATVHIVAQIRNSEAEQRRVTVTTTIYDAMHKQVAKRTGQVEVPGETKIENAQPASLRQSFTIVRPALWSIEQPTRYTAITELQVDGKKSRQLPNRIRDPPFFIRYRQRIFIEWETR